jgi:hypothetical protein
MTTQPGPTAEQRSLEPDEILFLISIDTEEDNWVPTRDNITQENARQLPGLQAMFDRLGVRPTYFVTNTLAVDPTACGIIRDLSYHPGVEIGAHLHPWNTPPMDEVFTPRNTMLHNIPADLQRAKLEHLTDSLAQCLEGRRPTSFRAGRWGIGSDTIGALIDCGYRVDSSVTPYTSWVDTDEGPSHIGAPVHSYRLSRGSDVREPSRGPIIEVPPAFGVTRAPLAPWNRFYETLTSAPARGLFLDRIASWTRLIRSATLNPEVSPMKDMVALTHALIEEGVRHLHLYFHSPTLCPGLTPFVHTRDQRDRFVARIEEYIEWACSIAKLRFATVAEAAAILEPELSATV